MFNRVMPFYGLLKVIFNLSFRSLISVDAAAPVKEMRITDTRIGILSRKFSSSGSRSRIVLSEDELIVVLVHLGDVVLQQLLRILLALWSLYKWLLLNGSWHGRRHEGGRVYRHEVFKIDFQLYFNRALFSSVTWEPVLDCLGKDSRV